ncbi:hypothetical protein [Mycobacterium sp.]|jgi:hypothetical protein|uniref:hypothetical protein n=1 Tax=Mycobacterium sp. TaxID=1785 RepID=UPI002BB758C5|nr:hypothetical protein [Mycobacterium sp.]HTH89222.1 hypothetical protein [Mycobacterium sp.]
MKIKRIIAVAGALTALTITGVGYTAHADPLSPLVPNPPFWCPGNGPGLSASGYGGYCEGKTFPDGTRLNVYRLGYFWQPIRCIIPDGSKTPPLAPPGGCGGLLG